MKARKIIAAVPIMPSADITIGATLPSTGSARTPNEIASSSEASAYGRPSRTPARTRAESAALTRRFAAGEIDGIEAQRQLEAYAALSKL